MAFIFELGAEFSDGACARGGHARHWRGRSRPRGRGRQRWRQLDVGREVITVGHGDGILAGLGQHLEFFGLAAADGAGVGLHDAEIQPHAFEHARVGDAHGGIPLLQ